MDSVVVPRSAHRLRRIATLAKISLIGILVIVALIMIVNVAGVGAQHFSGGCNHIPLVNGHPQYPCTSQPGG